MSKGRLEAFSDGVIAILITIMVLELKVPHGTDWAALSGFLPVLSSYVLSFVFLGIYWSNHPAGARRFADVKVSSSPRCVAVGPDS
ncbi:MAG TPA: TMEM175 family protein [Thermoanaerobaculia bacterium]|nr:TMEM175 family protein [Thermoanaerobaculia bacterium]